MQRYLERITLRKPKVGAPKIKAPGTEDMVVTYNAKNNRVKF